MPALFARVLPLVVIIAVILGAIYGISRLINGGWQYRMSQTTRTFLVFVMTLSLGVVIYLLLR